MNDCDDEEGESTAHNAMTKYVHFQIAQHILFWNR